MLYHRAFSFCLFSGGGIGGGGSMQFTRAERPVFLRPSVCVIMFSASGNVFYSIVLFYKCCLPRH